MSISGMALRSFLEAPKFQPKVRCKALNSAGAEALGSNETISNSHVTLYDESFSEANSHWNAVRTFHYDVTYKMPDGIRGEHILPKNMLDKWWDYMEKAQTRGKELIDELAPKMPKIHDWLRHQMQPIVYDEVKDRIPTEDDIKSKWRINFRVRPIVDSTSVICKWENEGIKRMKEEIDKSNSELLSSVTKEAYEKLLECIDQLRDNTADERASKIGMCREAPIIKLKELAEIMPKMNISGDPTLDYWAGQIKDKFADISIASMKQDDEERCLVHDTSTVIAEQLRKMMNA
tara:strand:- start:1209 stop:2081 length:873 start_codon:yes stop_codon:yes gene_type:complete